MPWWIARQGLRHKALRAIRCVLRRPACLRYPYPGFQYGTLLWPYRFASKILMFPPSNQRPSLSSSRESCGSDFHVGAAAPSCLRSVPAGRAMATVFFAGPFHPPIPRPTRSPIRIAAASLREAMATARRSARHSVPLPSGAVFVPVCSDVNQDVAPYATSYPVVGWFRIKRRIPCS